MYEVLVQKHIKSLECLKSDKGCFIVYKGFPLYFIFQISKRFRFVNSEDEIFSNGVIDLNKIKNNVNNLIQRLLKTQMGKFIMLYEEFCVLKDNINLEIFRSNFYIYENNIFYKYPNQTTIKFLDIENEIDAGNYYFKENDLFKNFYSNSLIKKEINFIQYRDFHENNFKNIVFKDFFGSEVIDNIKIEDMYTKEIEEGKKCGEIEIPLSDNQDDEDYNNLIYDIFQNNQIKDLKLIVDKQLFFKAGNRYKNEIKILKYLFEENKKRLFLVFKTNIIEKEKIRKDFYDILSNYWKSESFRNLTFYENPDLNRKKVDVSQGNLVELIAEQSEKAYRREKFSDIFITAPTGSGKSILFQIPAIYNAEKNRLVTIVATPLKALMYDQVTALNRRGAYNVAFINSDISLFERESIIEKIKKGEIDILYLSPELLLSYDLKFFIGKRLVGLLVVDEAHLVTTWGRDFRVDYWFLGKYIYKLRKYSNSLFPVLALTATAVYQGPDDIVFDTISSLNIKNVKIYIGSVVRNEINFMINNFEYEGSHELKKIENTVKIIQKYIEDNIKAIVYCPYVKHIEDILLNISEKYINKVGKYYGGMQPEEKEIVIENYKLGIICVIIATKAFGMGIDISDISEIYHHAPSGNLYDYIQEIGRVARDKRINGFATTDFNYKDLKFTKILYGLSSIKQYQVKLVMEKLYDIYNMNDQKQNMLVSPEDFGFIFWNDKKSLENKVKSAFLLLEKDLIRKYKFNVLIIRPKSLFTTVYACIDSNVDKEFVSKYGSCIELVSSINKNKREDIGKVRVCDIGNIYKIKLDRIWEKFFYKDSFPTVKFKFFNKELFGDICEYVIPRYKLTIKLERSPNKILECLNNYFDIITEVFNKLQGGFFTKIEMEKELRSFIKNNIFVKRVSNLLLSLFTSRATIENDFSLQFDTFIQSKRSANGEGKYRVIDSRYSSIKHFIVKKFKLLFSDDCQFFQKYITVNNRETEFRIKIAYLLEAFDLGSYEIAGGQLPQIFIRINDPYKIRTLIQSSDYRNEILQDVENRHKRGIKIMEKFFGSIMNNEERWNFIEDYFLGEEVV